MKVYLIRDKRGINASGEYDSLCGGTETAL